MRTSLCFILPIAALAAGPAMAWPAVSTKGVLSNEVPAVLITSPLPQPVPQYNSPGAELALPQPGDPIQQLSPLGPLNAMPGSPVVQLPPLGTTINPLQQNSPMGTTVP